MEATWHVNVPFLQYRIFSWSPAWNREKITNFSKNRRYYIVKITNVSNHYFRFTPRDRHLFILQCTWVSLCVWSIKKISAVQMRRHSWSFITSCSFVAVVSSSDDKKVPPVVSAFTAPVSTVGEVTSSDTTAVPAEPSAVSQDRVCVLKMTCNFELYSYDCKMFSLSL